MRLRHILIGSAIFTAAVVPVFPQTTSCNNSGVRITGSLYGYPMRPVVGAPYSARQSSESIQTLPDGTHITRKGHHETLTWRDSHGRVRTELRYLPPIRVATRSQRRLRILWPVMSI
jgi:hypothetical protein